MLPKMSDADLSSLRANAERLIQLGLPGQIAAASEVIRLSMLKRRGEPRFPSRLPRRVFVSPRRRLRL